MKHLAFALLIVIITELITFSCANPKTPTGGEKDTIPPELISSRPQNQSLNFHDNIIKLTFDEYINADKLRNNLIITPITEIAYKTIVKKNTLTIILEQPLNDSTTYTFNFFDGVTDITERTPASNLIIAFSSGPYIDSLQISGTTYDIQDRKPLQEITIGLYSLTDTLDFQIVKPTYFIKSNEDGQFNITNIKAGTYKLLAFNDDNGNLLFDPADEAHGFIPDTIKLSDNNLDSLNIPLVRQDVSDFELTSSRPSGHYFNLKYSKPIIRYSIQSHKTDTIYSLLIDDRKTIRLYPEGFIQDSTQIITKAIDTLNNTAIDTVFVKLRQSSKKLDQLTITNQPPNNTVYTEETLLGHQFNKPLLSIIDTSFLYYKLDSIIKFKLPVTNFELSPDRTLVTYNTSLSKQAITDSLQHYLDIHPIDTLHIDSLQLPLNNRIKSLINSSKIPLSIQAATFISVENDTSSEISNTYKFPDQQDYGTIKLTLTDTLPSYIVQLISEDKVITSKNNCTVCTFQQLLPGTYWIRIMVDANADNHWSPGNINTNLPPEPIIYFNTETVLRANWEVELNYSLDNSKFK